MALGLGGIAAGIIAIGILVPRTVAPPALPTSTPQVARGSGHPSGPPRSPSPSSDPRIAGTIQVETVPITSEPALPSGSNPVWTGSELLFTGKQNTQNDCTPTDGVRYDPTAGTWRPMSAAPIDLFESRATWTGTEMLVAAGDQVNARCKYQSRRDVAAAYDPGTDTWRRIADPLVTVRYLDQSVWTGDRWVLGNGGDAFAAYDPNGDRWRMLPLLKRSWGFNDALLWTGDELVVVGLSGTYELALDALHWTVTRGTFIPFRAVWAGDRAFGLSIFNEVLEWTPGGDWHLIDQPAARDVDDPEAGIIDTSGELDLLWTGTLLLLLDQGRAFDPATSTWWDLEPASALATWDRALLAGDRILVVDEVFSDGVTLQDWESFALRR